MIQRPLLGLRGSGPGVAVHAAPDSSSRMKMTSPVGSVIGSLANGVSLFSRLFSFHVNAPPDEVTIVPNCSLASTLDQGNGVSRSPSSTITYSRPSGVKPPTPFAMTSGGTAAGTAAGSGG